LHNLNNISILVQKYKNMTRQEFSAQLAAIRKATDIKMKDICYTLNVLQDAIYRLEGGKFNYDTNRMLAYCQCIGIELEIHYAGTDVVIDNYDTLLSTIIDIRKNAGYTQENIASTIGVSRQAIAYAEIRKNTLTIDIMLKICDTCGAVITIKKKGGEACGLENQQN
jgi:toxin-antitoxin system, antitoxin component, xre family